MHRHQHIATRNMKNQWIITLPRAGGGESRVINPKEMETYKLPDKEFKIIILMKLNELQESTVRRQDKNQENHTCTKWEKNEMS